jgi:pimeloyl-ACP methyl ester carboxylesterase
MIPADDTFNGTFPFRPRFTQAPGFQMHYVDEGEGEPIVCLHGEPTWAYLYWHLIPPLSKRHRVIVPDHMGFGRSETPVDREYTLGTPGGQFGGAASRTRSARRHVGHARTGEAQLAADLLYTTPTVSSGSAY